MNKKEKEYLQQLEKKLFSLERDLEIACISNPSEDNIYLRDVTRAKWAIVYDIMKELGVEFWYEKYN